MIARPLDLASRLRPAPRNFDAWFYVDAGAIVLFFLLFGSRFVLAPGLGVDFALPQVAGASAGASPVTHYVSVKQSGQIYAADGQLTLEQFRAWLREQARTTPHARLLVRASAGVTTARMAEIAGAARDAGFEAITWAADEPAAGGGQ
jgi:biopolymer transport protein ExbD